MDEVADAFAGLYGEVQYGHVESASGDVRKLRVEVEFPGYGPPPLATLVFIEKHYLSHGEWERFEYLYDLHLEPRPSGRYAFHWHDDVPHRHCADPTRPRPDHHFDGDAFDDIGWAAGELSQIASTGVTCVGLRPLRDTPPEPDEP